MDELTSKAVRKDIEQIKKTLTSMDKTLALQQQSLDLHIKRSDMLEQKLVPIEKHVEQVRGISKFVAFLVVLASAIAAYLVVKW